MVVDDQKIKDHVGHRIKKTITFCKNFKTKFMLTLFYCNDCDIPIGCAFEIMKDYDKKLEGIKWRSQSAGQT